MRQLWSNSREQTQRKREETNGRQLVHQKKNWKLAEGDGSKDLSKIWRRRQSHDCNQWPGLLPHLLFGMNGAQTKRASVLIGNHQPIVKAQTKCAWGYGMAIMAVTLLMAVRNEDLTCMNIYKGIQDDENNVCLWLPSFRHFCHLSYLLWETCETVVALSCNTHDLAYSCLYLFSSRPTSQFALVSFHSCALWRQRKFVETILVITISLTCCQ